jgi:hypothetical protein
MESENFVHSGGNFVHSGGNFGVEFEFALLRELIYGDLTEFRTIANQDGSLD